METVAASGAPDTDTHRQLLTNIEMVWNLSEIVLIDQKRGESARLPESQTQRGRAGRD